MNRPPADAPPALDTIFALPGAGRARFTGRAEGNMSSVGGDGREQAAANRRRLRTSLGLATLARGFQVHGATVEIVAAHREDPPGNESLARADGQATRVAGIGVAVLAADCLPIALGADGAVAMLHAGWRGLAAGVIEQGVCALRSLGAAGPFAAVVGPGAGACCYEVGPEVHAALGDPARAPANIDLRAIAHRRLRAAGAARIADLDLCTICDPRLHSHRREGQAAGRNMGVAWLS